MTSGQWRSRFQEYFSRSLAEEAAKPLKPEACVQFRIGDEDFYFTRRNGRNEVCDGQIATPDFSFELTTKSAERILQSQAQGIGEAGIELAQLILSREASERISVRLHSGFFSLFRKGYLGVVAAGGAAFARFLASRGFGGADGIRKAVKKLSSNSSGNSSTNSKG